MRQQGRIESNPRVGPVVRRRGVGGREPEHDVEQIAGRPERVGVRERLSALVRGAVAQPPNQVHLDVNGGSDDGLEGRLEQPRVEIVLVGKGQRLVRSVHPANGHLEGATGEEAGRQRVEQGVPLDPPGLGVKAPPARLQEVEITRRGHGAPPSPPNGRSIDCVHERCLSSHPKLCRLLVLVQGPQSCQYLVAQVAEFPITNLNEPRCASDRAVRGPKIEHWFPRVMGKRHQAPEIANSCDLAGPLKRSADDITRVYLRNLGQPSLISQHWPV